MVSRMSFGISAKARPSGYPITVFYAFKQAETDDDGGHASTGWETLLEGMIQFRLGGHWDLADTNRATAVRTMRHRNERSRILHRPGLSPAPRRRWVH